MKLPEWAKWLAKDVDGALNAYENKPYKSFVMGEWLSDDAMCRISEVATPFDNVEWSDDEPTEIINMMTNHTQAGDPVNHPSHYNQGGIETLDLIRLYLTPEEYKGYLKGNIIKYRERSQFKGNAEQDYAKAKFYYDEVAE